MDLYWFWTFGKGCRDRVVGAFLFLFFIFSFLWALYDEILVLALKGMFSH